MKKQIVALLIVVSVIFTAAAGVGGTFLTQILLNSVQEMSSQNSDIDESVEREKSISYQDRFDSDDDSNNKSNNITFRHFSPPKHFRFEI